MTSGSRETGRKAMNPPQMAEAEWLAETAPETMNFVVLGNHEPMRLRRHSKIEDALAQLLFGGPVFPKGLWLGMIVSERKGQGRVLLDRIKRLADRHQLTIIGDPVPLKPTNWDASRPWNDREDEIADWYVRRGFRIVPTDWDTVEVIYP
jgi:hypothetical protein